MVEENGIERTGDERKAEIARQISNVQMALAPTDIEVDTRRAIRLPLDQVPAIASALASLPETVRTTTSTISVPKLLTATDKSGNALDPSVLQSFNDGSGLMGSFRDSVKGFGQARLHVVGGDVIETSSTIPYDPTSLFVAAALVQINAKLDAIQETQEEMFEYLRQKDKAKQRGNLQTLSDTLSDYASNRDNGIWRGNTHMKVLDIRQDAEQSIIQMRAQIKGKLSKKGLVESRLTLGARLDDLCDAMREYQLAVYLYSFASFLEPMLSENFDEGYLRGVSAKIEARALDYRRLYTRCYDELKKSSDDTVDSALLGGVSFVGKSLGRAIAATPVGERTQIDEALIGAGKGVGRFNREQTDSLMARLRKAKSPEVGPFKSSVDEVNRLYNKPMRMFVDSESVYLLSKDEDETAA